MAKDPPSPAQDWAQHNPAPTSIFPPDGTVGPPVGAAGLVNLTEILASITSSTATIQIVRVTASPYTLPTATGSKTQYLFKNASGAALSLALPAATTLDGYSGTDGGGNIPDLPMATNAFLLVADAASGKLVIIGRG